LFLEPYDPDAPERNLTNVPTPLPPLRGNIGMGGVGAGGVGGTIPPTVTSNYVDPRTASPAIPEHDPIGPELRARFASLFASCQPVNGQLDGG
jgi:hypothetical protein